MLEIQGAYCSWLANWGESMLANTSPRFRKELFGPGSPSCILIANAFFMASTRW